MIHEILMTWKLRFRCWNLKTWNNGCAIVGKFDSKFKLTTAHRFIWSSERYENNWAHELLRTQKLFVLLHIIACCPSERSSILRSLTHTHCRPQVINARSKKLLLQGIEMWKKWEFKKVSFLFGSVSLMRSADRCGCFSLNSFAFYLSQLQVVRRVK